MPKYDGDGEETHYYCQATRLYDATEPLSSWSIRQYVYEL